MDDTVLTKMLEDFTAATGLRAEYARQGELHCTGDCLILPVEGGELRLMLPPGTPEETIRAAAGILARLWAAHVSGGEAEARRDMLLTLIMEKRRAEEAALRSMTGAYPLHKEKELLTYVRLGDRSGARRILNEMLGWIFLSYEGNVDVIKARVVELLSMVSRAAVETGAPLGQLLAMNNRNIAELMGIGAFDGVCAWVARALDAFMDVVYNSRDVESTRFISVALKYMNEHYARPLTLDVVAQAAHISQYYLSHLFREELGETFLERLTFIRMENARRLLCDTAEPIRVIAASVGYDDAGYFAKVFRKAVGETPRGYRDRMKA